VSQEVEQVLRGKGFRGDIQQLYHSYDPELFKVHPSDERQHIRDEFALPRDAILIGYFGRLTVEKGLPDLVAALRLLEGEANLPPWFFCCVGNGPAEQDIRLALSNLPASRYRMLGALEHHRVGSLLAAIDVLVLPSRTTPRWKEQFGRILVEAMASGAAVVGSDSGEIPQLIERSGGGLVFREGRPDELAACLVRLLKEPALLEQHRSRGRSYVERTLSHPTVARDLAQKLRISAALQQ
jgi:glycosyltransferase involved in cell wall biosynthesis